MQPLHRGAERADRQARRRGARAPHVHRQRRASAAHAADRAAACRPSRRCIAASLDEMRDAVRAPAGRRCTARRGSPTSCCCCRARSPRRNRARTASRTDLYELAFETARAWVPAAMAASIDLGFDEGFGACGRRRRRGAGRRGDQQSPRQRAQVLPAAHARDGVGAPAAASRRSSSRTRAAASRPPSAAASCSASIAATTRPTAARGSALRSRNEIALAHAGAFVDHRRARRRRALRDPAAGGVTRFSEWSQARLAPRRSPRLSERSSRDFRRLESSGCGLRSRACDERREERLVGGLAPVAAPLSVHLGGAEEPRRGGTNRRD